MTKYWDIPSGQADPDGREPTENELVEELRDILERAVRRQMISDVPVGALLSGGLDSSLVVALMRRMTQGPISTYTIRFSSQDKQMEAMSDDAGYASKVSRLFSTDHHEILAAQETNDLLPMILWHLDDPVADSASINTYLIASAAKAAGTTVLLNGMGGDEVFAGYRNAARDPARRTLSRASPDTPSGRNRTVSEVPARGHWRKRLEAGAVEPKVHPERVGDADGLVYSRVRVLHP